MIGLIQLQAALLTQWQEYHGKRFVAYYATNTLIAAIVDRFPQNHIF